MRIVLVTGGGSDHGQGTPWSFSFFIFYILFPFFTWPWEVEQFPCPGDSLAHWPSCFPTVGSGDGSKTKTVGRSLYGESVSALPVYTLF